MNNPLRFSNITWPDSLPQTLQNIYIQCYTLAWNEGISLGLLMNSINETAGQLVLTRFSPLDEYSRRSNLHAYFAFLVSDTREKIPAWLIESAIRDKNSGTIFPRHAYLGWLCSLYFLSEGTGHLI